MPAGRPTDYDPAFCEDVIRLGRQGKSVEQIAYRLFVSVSTMYKWREEHPGQSVSGGRRYC